MKYGWDSRTPNRSPRQLRLERRKEDRIGEVPFASRRDARPGIRGTLRLTITPWNSDVQQQNAPEAD